MLLMFGHIFNLVLKFFRGLILSLMFVLKLKYLFIIDRVNRWTRWTNSHLTPLMSPGKGATREQTMSCTHVNGVRLSFAHMFTLLMV